MVRLYTYAYSRYCCTVGPQFRSRTVSKKLFGLKKSRYHTYALIYLLQVTSHIRYLNTSDTRTTEDHRSPVHDLLVDQFRADRYLSGPVV